MLGGSVAQVSSRLVGMSIGLLSTMLLARYLGIADYGRLTAVLGYWVVFSLVSEMGVSSVLTSEMSRPGADVAADWEAGLVIQLAYSAVAVIVGVALAPVVLGTASISVEIIAVGSVLCFASLPAVNSIHQVQMRLWIPSLIGILQSAAGLVLTLMGIYLAVDWPYFVGASAVAGVSATGANVIAARRAAGPRRPSSSARLRSFARMSLPIGLAGVFATAYYRMDTVLVFRFAGSSASGAYAAAYRLYELGLIVPTAVMAAALPAAVRELHISKVAFGKYAGDVLRLLITTASIYMLVVAVFGRFALNLIFGSEFDSAWLVLLLLLPAVIARFASIWLGTLLIASSNRRRYLQATAAVAGVAILLYAALIIPLGAVGAAIATTLIEWTALAVIVLATPRPLRFIEAGRTGALVVPVMFLWALSVASYLQDWPYPVTIALALSSMALVFRLIRLLFGMSRRVNAAVHQS